MDTRWVLNEWDLHYLPTFLQPAPFINLRKNKRTTRIKPGPLGLCFNFWRWQWSLWKQRFFFSVRNYIAGRFKVLERLFPPERAEPDCPTPLRWSKRPERQRQQQQHREFVKHGSRCWLKAKVCRPEKQPRGKFNLFAAAVIFLLLQLVI